MKIFAFIFARGGSKGIPRKNLQLINDKPLIVWSIEIAKSSPQIQNVFVSTEDDEISKIASDHGAEIILRPKYLIMILVLNGCHGNML